MLGTLGRQGHVVRAAGGKAHTRLDGWSRIHNVCDDTSNRRPYAAICDTSGVASGGSGSKRQYALKGTDLSVHTFVDLKAIAEGTTTSRDASGTGRLPPRTLAAEMLRRSPETIARQGSRLDRR